MRDDDISAYDGTAEKLQREASGVSAGDLPLLFAAVMIGIGVGLFNRLRRRHQPAPLEAPEHAQKQAQPSSPSSAPAVRPAPHPAEFLHPHGC